MEGAKQMSEKENSADDDRVDESSRQRRGLLPTDTTSRRRVLHLLGIGGITSLAGCGSEQPGGDGTATPTDTGQPTDTPTSTETQDSQRGGKPVVGLTNEPQAFNPLLTSDTTTWAIMGRFYTYPTTPHSDDISKPGSFLFRDWSFDPDSLTGTIDIVENLQWSDGTEFTAEDVAFTFNYLINHEGHRYVQNVSNIKEIDTAGSNTIEFSLTQEVAAVFEWTGVFAAPILPEHIWSDVEDFQNYNPDELIGSQGWKWADANPGNWYELEARPDMLPDGIHEGPYVDRLRFRVFGDMTSLVNALQNGEVDLTYDSVTPNRAFQLQDREDIKVWTSPTQGYNYIAFNMRRVPFDDKPFRQSLGFAYPFNYLVNTLRKGLSNIGDYVAAKVYEPWRPDGFNTPFDHGPYRTEDGKLDVQRTRSFLENADGDHAYSFGPVESSQVTGDQELRVDGELLTTAHTDNDGNAGQGPLSLIVTPPGTKPIEARSARRFVENLNEVGIPAELEPVAANSQRPRVWKEEKFDMWASGWSLLPKPHFYLGFWLRSGAADLESNKDGFHFNAMGYTNADDLIEKVETTYDPQEQRQATKRALARIYEDMPVLVTEYPDNLHATTTAFEGWVQMPGGISLNPWSYLNVRQT